MRARVAASVALILVSAGCSAGAADRAPSPPAAPRPSLPPPPWASARLPASGVPPVYLEQWSRAPNRDTCAPVAPADAGAGRGAAPRAASFSGGWAVAYDTPAQRSAFGVAGTGVRVADPRSHDWPRRMEWSDGSRAEYGPEGGTGPNQLAYLEIAGQGCLYNVWSRLGIEHLEHLLRQLRFVEPAGGGAAG